VQQRDARTLSPSAQEELRRRAVRLVIGEGKSQAEAARLLAVSRQSVNGWVRDYRARGEFALAARTRGRRPREQMLLAPWQQAQICKAIREKNPDQLKLPFFLWTREAVRDLIERRFKLRLALTTVGKYLRRWGFTAQKPVRRAFEQNPAAVRAWLEEIYPAIAAKAKREKALVLWGDEMGLRSDQAAGRSFAPRGKTPAIAGSGQRFGANVISVISNRGQLYFMVFRGKANAVLFLAFLRRLLRQLKGRRLFLIVDGHPSHRAKLVKAFVNENSERLALYYLPPYSPELNPDELLNQDVKSNALGRRRPRNQQELIADTRSYLHRRQRQPDVVARYFNEDNVRYAAAA
jgi:transposase